MLEVNAVGLSQVDDATRGVGREMFPSCRLTARYDRHDRICTWRAFDSRSCTVAVFPKRLNCSSAVTFEFSERFSCFSFKRKCMGHRRNYLGRPIITNVDKSSAVAGMGNRLATIDMGHKERD